MKEGENLKEINFLLEKFTKAHGASGFENNIRDLLEMEIGPYIDTIRKDVIGNLIATNKGKGPSIMLAAHIDEIGLMIKYIDDDGFFCFVEIGRWFDQVLFSQRVMAHGNKGSIPGVIGSKPLHLMREDERNKPVKLEDLFIDIGAKNKGNAENLGIEIGTTATIDRQFISLANGVVTSKALDDRIRVVLLIEILKRLSENKIDANIYAVGTVQKEVGLKGAKTCTFGLAPSLALALDITSSGDYPDVSKIDSSLEIGKGPVITVADKAGRGLIGPLSGS